MFCVVSRFLLSAARLGITILEPFLNPLIRGWELRNLRIPG